MSEHMVIGAAVIQDGRLLVARRASPPCVAGRWEFPGDEMGPDENEQATVRRVFAVEFNTLLSLWTERVLSDRWIHSWRKVEGESVPATLRLLRCRVENGTTLDLAAGEPRPNRLAYDESRWVPLDELHDVYPWSDEHAYLAEELAALYHYEAQFPHDIG
ncbi:8-oxo-dGTP diphosphatase [Actinokineospora alba]|uniref:8-oxo-dGTP diphosphatase n=1 Tax=Actinokineospora alba TaxID=504798 RepID=A0A1H0F718_9PSEU|nr:NUDIX domain-containing protein [Actinokineospora alba]TDP69364.1 8-oxo-dGTP diphosphatase [Actinokineospora alba]SDI18335.1 8-oxo-dGTP diphosphatase [Actinokineospora alba]SDN90359.1 8-oxo-dGTP diphosphatase [Actinokineospora alba]